MPNKAQHDLIGAFAAWTRLTASASRLYLVGGSAPSGYQQALRDLAAALGVADAVQFVGPVAHAELLAYFRAADVFVCLSEHEGFCVPILEAMHVGLPVVALAEAAVPDTLGDAGLLLESKRPVDVVAAVARITQDGPLRGELLRRGRRRAADFALDRTAPAFLAALAARPRGGQRPLSAKRGRKATNRVDRWPGEARCYGSVDRGAGRGCGQPPTDHGRGRHLEVMADVASAQRSPVDDVSLTAPSAGSPVASATPGAPSPTRSTRYEARASAPRRPIPHQRVWVAARWLVITIVAVGGLWLRQIILAAPISGVTNADEATTGLLAIGILRGNLPFMLPGQSYSGTLEAYAVAPFYGLFGTTNLALKFVNIFFWAAAAVACYFLARLVLTRLGSTAAALIVWAPGLALILLSTRAYPGYVTGFVCYLLALWCLGRVAETDEPSLTACFVAGLFSGLAIWLHPMFTCLVAPAIAVVTWRHRRALLRWAAPGGLGLLVGMAPFLIYNIANNWASFHQPPDAFPDVTYTERLSRFVKDLWPRTLGLHGVGPVWSFAGAKYVYLLAIVAAFAGLLLLWRRGWAGKMLTVTAVVSPFLLALLNNLSFSDDGRYGINFLAFFAIGICALVEDLTHRVATLRRVALLVLPVAWLLLIARPSVVNLVPDSPGTPEQAIHAVIDRLDAAQIDRVRTTYFIAQPIVLDSDERILAALTSGPIRFPYLERAVDATDPRQVAYVFGLGAPTEFDSRALPLDQYERIEVGPYVIYLPKPVPAP